MRILRRQFYGAPRGSSESALSRNPPVLAAAHFRR